MSQRAEEGLHMQKITIAALLTLVLSAWAGSAKAAILLQDNFDGYANQAAFAAAWPASGSGTTTAGTSGTLSTVQAFSAPNSVR